VYGFHSSHNVITGSLTVSIDVYRNRQSTGSPISRAIERN
jgi:hypothetical protein